MRRKLDALFRLRAVHRQRARIRQAAPDASIGQAGVERLGLFLRYFRRVLPLRLGDALGLTLKVKDKGDSQALALKLSWDPDMPGVPSGLDPFLTFEGGPVASEASTTAPGIAPRAAEIDASHEFPWDVVEHFRDQGIFGLFFAEEAGGTGTGTRWTPWSSNPC